MNHYWKIYVGLIVVIREALGYARFPCRECKPFIDRLRTLAAADEAKQ